MKFTAPAKINLYLEVIRRRKDGYHDIETIMQTVSLCDELTFSRRKEGVLLKCSRPELANEQNLVFRAAKLLIDRLNLKTGVKITLKKRIPAGAGLGGGSSDAAAALRGLLKFWNRKLNEKELAGMAASLGADVPFFLSGGTAQATGIGERVKPLPNLPKTWFLLVNPRVHVPTASVYKKLQFPLTNKQKINKIRRLISGGFPPEPWENYLFNRLEEVVLPRVGAIREIKNVLGRLGARGVMSGSGSTVFAPVPTATRGEVLRKKLRKFPWDVWLVSSTC